ncbi:Uncharacterised protein [Vibrio cholerae]|nr:Uncharacterised protein [Vibrio cholerae]
MTVRYSLHEKRRVRDDRLHPSSTECVHHAYLKWLPSCRQYHARRWL